MLFDFAPLLKGLSNGMEGVLLLYFIFRKIFKYHNHEEKKHVFVKGPVNKFHLKILALYQVGTVPTGDAIRFCTLIKGTV